MNLETRIMAALTENPMSAKMVAEKIGAQLPSVRTRLSWLASLNRIRPAACPCCGARVYRVGR